jgi:hypothetical protein
MLMSLEQLTTLEAIKQFLEGTQAVAGSGQRFKQSRKRQGYTTVPALVTTNRFEQGQGFPARGRPVRRVIATQHGAQAAPGGLYLG